MKSRQLVVEQKDQKVTLEPSIKYTVRYRKFINYLNLLEDLRKAKKNQNPTAEQRLGKTMK